MAKYHIKADGNPGVCKAAEGKCPYGADAKHFDSKEAAQAYAEKKTAESFENIPEDMREFGVVEMHCMTDNAYNQLNKEATKQFKKDGIAEMKKFLKDNYGEDADNVDFALKDFKSGLQAKYTFDKDSDGNIVKEKITINRTVAIMYAMGLKEDALDCMNHQMTRIAFTRKNKGDDYDEKEFQNALASKGLASKSEGAKDPGSVQYLMIRDEATTYDGQGNETGHGYNYEHKKGMQDTDYYKKNGVVVHVVSENEGKKVVAEKKARLKEEKAAARKKEREAKKAEKTKSTTAKRTIPKRKTTAKSTSSKEERKAWNKRIFGTENPDQDEIDMYNALHRHRSELE